MGGPQQLTSKKCRDARLCSSGVNEWITLTGKVLQFSAVNLNLEYSN